MAENSAWINKARNAARVSWFQRLTNAVRPQSPSPSSSGIHTPLLGSPEPVQCKPMKSSMPCLSLADLTPAEAAQVRTQIRAEIYTLSQSCDPEDEVKERLMALMSDLRTVTAICDR
eukprot:m51a1_g1270 hypothetical protein (117) ;mRNA; f:95979-96649